jgi:tetratricopeptide (TPR) repeat protein
MARPRLAGTILAAAAFLGCTLVALPALARDDDVDFATSLADRGYDDLAQQEIDRMPKGESAEFTRCQLLRRAALLAAFNEKTEPKDVRPRFDAARKAFEAFLGAYPGSPHRGQAELSMSSLMKDFAYYLTKNIDRFEAKDHNAVIDEAAKVFEDAIRYLTTIKQREEEKDKDKPDTDETKNADRNQAWYYLCLAMHDRAMLKPAGDAVRIQQFTQAIEETQKLLEETDGGIFGYHAYNIMGLDYWHRGQMQKGWSADDIAKAREFFSGTLSAKDLTGIEQEWSSLVDLICDTAVNFGQMCNEVGTLESGTGTVNYPNLLHEEAKKILEKLPSVKSRQAGLKMLIEDARAMSAIGFAEAAITQLNQISNWASQSDPSWGRAVDQMAKHALNEVLAAIPPDSTVQLGPDVLFKAGDGSFRDGNFGRAIRAYQRVLLAVENEPDADRKKTLTENFLGECWLKINECYVRLDRPLEAYFAANAPVQQFLSSGKAVPDKDTSNLAFYRVTALQNLVARAPKDQKADLQDQLKRAQELFTTRFQETSDQGQSVTYTVAMQRLAAGTSQMHGGDVAKGQATLKEAIDLFGKVGAKDPSYGHAQAHIGEALVLSGNPQEALKHLQAYIARNLADWNNPATPPRQRQPWGMAVYWIANAYDALKQPAKVIETLDGYEKRFKDSALEATIPGVRFLRITALVKAGRGPEAEKETDQLVADSPDNPWTPSACLATASDLKVQADKAHHEGNQKGYLDLKVRSGKYYDFWVRRSSDAGADQMTFVGQLMQEIGNQTRAAELWQKAMDIYRRQGNAKMVETLTINLSGLLVNQGRYAEALPQFESLFVKTPDDVQPLRDCYEALRHRPVNVEAPIWDKKVKDTLTVIGLVLAKDPDGAAQSGEAKKAAVDGNTEVLIRAYADTPDLRRALARATSLTILGNDSTMPPDLRNAVFQLVKRTPDLLAHLARCYEELATTSPENPIRAVNIYSMLIESSPAPEDPDAPPPGSKYSESWFGWKFHWAKVFLTTGIAYKHEGSLRTVCDIIRNMETLNELKRADRERQDMGKEFAALRDQADSALRGLSKEGCK